MKVIRLLIQFLFLTVSSDCLSVNKSMRSVSLICRLADSDDSWEGFNPFERKETSTKIPSIISSSRISVRRIKMKEMMSKLLSSSPENFDSILQENETLIMEPLIDNDAVLDEDSIYQPGMSRDERFDIYDSAMRARENSAVNNSVKLILSKMRTFVMNRR